MRESGYRPLDLIQRRRELFQPGRDGKPVDRHPLGKVKVSLHHATLSIGIGKTEAIGMGKQRRNGLDGSQALNLGAEAILSAPGSGQRKESSV
jgi:hypothetical protein